MNVVPTQGPEIDLCRVCQMIWLDADELDELPERTERDRKDERWKEELRRIQRRREDRNFYGGITRRHSRMPF